MSQIEVSADHQAKEGNYKVQLASVGNPDHGENPNRSIPGVPKSFVPASTMANAAQICRDYIAKHDLGSGNWAGGDIVENGKIVAKVSYNGRVWHLP